MSGHRPPLPPSTLQTAGRFRFCGRENRAVDGGGPTPIRHAPPADHPGLGR